jgi:hypothetical protein
MSKTNTSDRTPVQFLTISAFKKVIGGTFRIVFNENSQKYSVLDEFDNFYRCQQTIDPSEPMSFLLEDGKDIADACLVNTKGDGNSPLRTIHTFGVTPAVTAEVDEAEAPF